MEPALAPCGAVHVPQWCWPNLKPFKPQPKTTDSIGFIFGVTSFLICQLYRQLTGHRMIYPVFKWLWKSWCLNKHCVFFSLLLVDRLSTRDILPRCNMDLPSYNCVYCQNGTVDFIPSFPYVPFCNYLLVSYTASDSVWWPLSSTRRLKKCSYMPPCSWMLSFLRAGAFECNEVTSSSKE